MLSKLLDPIQDVDAYLERINARKQSTLDKEYLDHLVYQHQLNVTFENVDMKVYQKEPSLEIDSLFQKVVTDHRGGVCFELNSLFYALLQSLGFEVYPCLCKVRLFVPSANVPSLHRATIVKLNGKFYYCDVGFGGPQPAGAIELVENVVQEYCREQYRFTSDQHIWTLELCMHGDEFIPAMEVNVNPVNPIDFLPLMHFACCREQKMLNHFTNQLMLNIRLKNGNASVMNHVLKTHIDGVETEKEIVNNSDMRKELANLFCLREEFVSEFLQAL